jgi:hypothetical protein
MTRPTPSARIAAVCVRGQRCKTIARNPHRLELAEAIVSTVLESNWQPLDAVLLPAGFLRLPSFIADLDFAGRAEVLARTRIGRSLIRQCRRLEAAFPGILIVTGIDGDGRDEGDDQLCVAFGAQGVVGVARKLFPTDHDIGCATAWPAPPQRSAEHPLAPPISKTACRSPVPPPWPPQRCPRRT